MEKKQKRHKQIIIAALLKVAILFILGVVSAYLVDPHSWVASAIIGASIGIAFYIVKKAFTDYGKENP